MRNSIRFFAAAFVAAALMTGCSNGNGIGSTTPSVVKAADVAPTPVTAKTALGPMYKAALAWSSDVQLMRLSPKELAGYKNADGKAAMWEAAFGSPSLHQYRLFTNSIAAVPPNIFKGVRGGLAMAWGGETRDAMAIDLTQFNVDSDAAFQTGSRLAGDWLKKNPNRELASFDIGQTYRFQGPVWYLQWGDQKAGYSVLVDANSGKVLNRK